MKRVRPGQPIVVGEITITPLERIVEDHGCGKSGFWAYGYKEPVSIVVDSPDGSWTIDLGSQERH